MKKILFSILFHKKEWSLPIKNKILILDNISAFKLSKYLLKHKKFTTFQFNSGILNMPILFLSLLNVFKYGKYSYHITFINYVEAEWALSTIDNNIETYEVFKSIYYCKLILFQNGRGDHFNNLKELNLKIDLYFFTNLNFLFHAKKYIKGEFFSTGTIISNSFNKCSKFSKIKKIQWISHFRPKKKLSENQYYKKYIEPSIVPLQSIIKFCIKNDLRLEILGRTNLKEEKLFYDKLLNGFKFKLRTNDLSKMKTNSYSAVSNDSIITGLDSQFLYENLSRGYRTVFFQTRSYFHKNKKLKFAYPYKTKDDFGFFWANKPNEKKFLKILDSVYKVNKAEWLNQIDKYKSTISRDPKNRFTRKVLKDKGIMIV